MNASKKLIISFFITLFVFTTAASASGKLKEIKAYLDPDVSVALNGKLVVSKPILYNNSTYVPLREVAAAFDAQILFSDNNKKDISVERIPEPAVEDPNPVPYHDVQVTFYSGFGKPQLFHKGIEFIVGSVNKETVEGQAAAVLTISVLNKSEKEFNFKPNLYIELEDATEEFDFNNQRYEIVGPDSVPANQTIKYQIIYHELPKSAVTYVSIVQNRLHDLVWVPSKPIVLK
ncbi:hypothetical protein EV294_101381 [Paenibacillus sp. BK033]|uniref:hypothetical protein n=1 Tax=Paenibacillus sp. BK033 TaxID=2512133 RepID=UPI0010539E18|nr:hypothetical protein [Paenibacillus sp. BK033]TCN00931.1 hypothetical protein EV294_101381 [Paenibacillus sp. BK033]